MKSDALSSLAQSPGLKAGQLAQLMHSAPKTARRLLEGKTVRSDTLQRFVASVRPTRPAWMRFRDHIISSAPASSQPTLEDRQLELNF